MTLTCGPQRKDTQQAAHTASYAHGKLSSDREHGVVSTRCDRSGEEGGGTAGTSEGRLVGALGVVEVELAGDGGDEGAKIPKVA